MRGKGYMTELFRHFLHLLKSGEFSEEIQLNETASTHRTMVDAVQAAAVNGGEFKSANVVPVAGSKIYYYYMERRN